jgi:hypothetical protein
MDAREILQKYGLDPPLVHEDFLRQIQRLPLYDRNWLYSPAPPPNELWQGDVVGPVSYVLTSEDNERGLFEGNVMLVSNTCDMVPAQSPFALVAPVFDVAIYTRPPDQAEETWANHLLSLRKFEISPFYYLPSWTEHPDSFADFSRMTHLPVAHLVDSFAADTLRRRASLSSKGHLLLLAKLAYFFVRLETDEVFRQTEI